MSNNDWKERFGIEFAEFIKSIHPSHTERLEAFIAEERKAVARDVMATMLEATTEMLMEMITGDFTNRRLIKRVEEVREAYALNPLRGEIK